MLEEERQQIIDDEQLRILSMGYLIAAGVDLLTSLVGLFYAGLGLVLWGALPRQLAEKGGSMPPAAMGWIFAAFGLLFFVVFIVFAVMKFMSARRLKQRRSRTLCLVTAGVSVIGIPYGTALGVCTFVVLSRPSVRSAFDR
ncbi:MAG: hypothetical protein JNL28_14845 [Planctomycetes bacterium]|nr:hypothetical protein [Planctomycetota bacterium]